MSGDFRADVAVVGAGLIGLAIAFELAQRGASVRVYDRDEPGRAASWAGAGMLAPYSESIDDEPMRALCAQSLAEYPAFIERVESASSIDSKLRLNGIVHAAFDDAELDALRANAAALALRGVRSELLDRAHIVAFEASLGAHVSGGLLVCDEGTVDNRRLGRALSVACEASGVEIERNAADLAVECDARRVLGIRCRRGFAPATTVVNATGAWAAHLAGVPAIAVPPIVPVKGQMLALAMPRGFVQRPIWLPGAYMVPRDDGRLLIGATVEAAAFDTRVTAEGVRTLLEAAVRAVPSLGEFALIETWAGSRPGSPDGRPILGPTPIDGLWNATGHFRNGILLAPVSARLIAESIASGNRSPQLAPFTVDRFKAEAAPSGRIRVS